MRNQALLFLLFLFPLFAPAQSYEYAELTIRAELKGKTLSLSPLLNDGNEQKPLPVQVVSETENLGMFISVLNQVCRDGGWQYVDQYRDPAARIYFLRRERNENTEQQESN